MKAYLAGGLSDWRTEVAAKLPDLTIHDPFFNSNQSAIYHFVGEDLFAVDESDFVLAVVDYERHTGTAVELGFAHARNKPIYLVWLLDTPPDSMMVGISKKLFLSLDDAIDHIDRRVLSEQAR